MATSGYTFFHTSNVTNYAPGCKHYVFSQWWPCKFSDPVTGMSYASTEQYMMAKKAELFGDRRTMVQILATSDPETAKELGRKVANFDPAAWSNVAFDVVVQGNVLKFSQDPELRRVLLSTGTTLLVEASPTDSIWGIGLTAEQAATIPEHQWPGTNLLGKALTSVREQIRGVAAEGRTGLATRGDGKETGLGGTRTGVASRGSTQGPHGVTGSRGLQSSSSLKGTGQHATAGSRVGSGSQPDGRRVGFADDTSHGSHGSGATGWGKTGTKSAKALLGGGQ